MKSFLFGFLGIIIGILSIIILFYIFIRTMLNKYGFKGKTMKSIYQESKQQKEELEKKPKQIGGLNQLLIPLILEDFPNFNEKEFYNQAEESIRLILKAIEKKEINSLNKKEYDLIREKINLQIEDLKEKKIDYYYSDIIFHKHTIKSYEKEKGMVKLDIASSLEYNYEKYENKKELEKKIKKQTRYTTTFIYIYDVEEAGFDVGILGVNCPNCGAPVKSLEQKGCEYCKSGLNIKVASLLKCWKIIEQKENY